MDVCSVPPKLVTDISLRVHDILSTFAADFAIEGDHIVLPCDLPSINWNLSERFGLGPELVKAGRVNNPKADKYRVLRDCSLEITHLVLKDAQTYSCESENLNSSVSLRILESKWEGALCIVCIFEQLTKMSWWSLCFFIQ